MTSNKLKRISESSSIRNRWKEIREIVIRRKSAFTVYEWLRIKEFMNVTE